MAGHSFHLFHDHDPSIFTTIRPANRDGRMIGFFLMAAKVSSLKPPSDEETLPTAH
jgi:hypothetical protein